MNRQLDVKALISHIVRGDGADKCRICMGDTTDGQVYLGDTVMMDGDRGITLSELLETITGVEICKEDLCPRGACLACTTSVVTAQQFRLLVQKSQKTWKNVVNCLEQLPVDYVGGGNKASCYAFIKTDDVSQIQIRIVKKQSGEDTKTVFNQLNCVTKKNTKKKPRAYRTGPACDCADCGTHFFSPYYLNLHLKNSGQKDACLICGVVVLRGMEMKEHLRSIHKIKSYLCSYCPALHNTETESKQHLEIAHKPGALTCGDCGRTFPEMFAFKSHSQMHLVRTCRDCGAQFSNRVCFRKHRAKCELTAKPDVAEMSRMQRSNVRDPATFICDYCGKMYTSRSELRKHIMWIHLNIRPYQCQFCDKKFYTPSRLAEHRVVHTRERNFECDLCGVRLVSKNAVVYHRRRHTGEKPYSCEECGECFISASRRAEHGRRRHNKGPRRECNFCAASFVTGHELKKHTRRMHSAQDLDKSESLIKKEIIFPKFS